MSTLRNKAFSGIIWGSIDRLGSQLVRFGIGVVLARLLLPSEFGLIGMVTILMGVSQVFVNCGFGEALIQRKDATHEDESSIFYANLLFGFLAAGALYFSAPWISVFYDQPGLVTVIRFMSLDVVIGSFGVVQTMLLTKKIDFKAQIKISFASTLVGGLIAVVMARQGFGVMSLVAQILVGDFIRTLLLWLLEDWRPARSFSLDSLKKMFPYGSRLFLSGLLNSVFGEIYSIVIGKLYEPATLGFFARARQLQALPLDNLAGIAGRVSFPIFAAIQDDKITLKRGVRKACRALVWLNFPVMVGLAVTAQPLVIVLLTDKWLACVPYLRLLCVSGALYPLSLIHVNVLSAQGRSDLFLKLEIIKKILIVSVVAGTFRYGVVGLLVGNIAVAYLSYYLNSYYSASLLNYSLREQLTDMLPYLALSAVMGVSVWLVSLLSLRGNIQLLIAQVLTGVGVYGLGCWLWQVAAFTDAWTLVEHKFFRSDPRA